MMIEFVLFMLIVGAFLAALLYWAKPDKGWEYDERNPHRRYCKKCGMQQDCYQYWNGAISWENVKPINYSTCRKHLRERG